MNTASKIFDDTFLALRSKLIDVAAMLDRIDRSAEGGSAIASHPRRQQIDQAIEVLAASSPHADRAKQIQQIFSRQYQPQWRNDFEL